MLARQHISVWEQCTLQTIRTRHTNNAKCTININHYKSQQSFDQHDMSQFQSAILGLRMLGHLSFQGTCRCPTFWLTCNDIGPRADTVAPFIATEVCLEQIHIEPHSLLARWCSVEPWSGVVDGVRSSCVYEILATCFSLSIMHDPNH